MTVIKREVTVSAMTSSLAEVREFVEDAVRTAGFGSRDQALIILAIDEAVTNIIQYNDSHQNRQSVTLKIDVNDTRLKASIDEGMTVFDVPGLPNGEMENYVRTESGFCMGIFLIRRIMDEVSYQFKKGFENSLTMIRYRRD